jgi:hypothetical protein
MGSERDTRGKKVVSIGASVGGAALGGPLGSLAGKAVEIVGSEVLERALGRAEQRRIRALRQVASARLAERLEQGERLRDDDFFTAPSEIGRRLSAPWGAPSAPAHEILEAIFLAAGRTYEEKKLPHLAEMLVALVLDGEVSPAYAHHLIRLADRLSYRQLLLLRIFNGESREEGLAEGDVRPDSRTGVGIEMEELARLGLFGTNEPGGDAYPTNSILEVGLSFIKTTYDGRKLYELMDLGRLAEQDVKALVDELSNTTGRYGRTRMRKPDPPRASRMTR